MIKNMLTYATIVVIILLSVTNVFCYTQHPPCYFNPLCTCSKVLPDLGTVTCTDVPLFRIPVSFNISRINELSISNNGLRFLDPYSFYGTGLYTLRITDNPLYILSDDVFSGLEFSLRELALRNLHLSKIPGNALQNLQRLRILDLSGNDISDIYADVWRGVEATLETLMLNNNAILYLPRNVFSGFSELKTLDLSGNLIIDIDLDAFGSYTLPRLQHIYLNDNQLKDVPYTQLHNMRSLRTLDLSQNLITQIENNPFISHSNTQSKLSLNNLNLEYNRITMLAMNTFKHFDSINKVHLDGNSISIINSGAFHNSNISELTMVNCDLTKITSHTFKGLEDTLQFLDLSNNYLNDIPQDLFLNFNRLKVLNGRNNLLQTFIIPEKGCHIEKFDISGSETRFVYLREISRMKELRSLSISKLKTNYLSSADFEGFGPNLEELRITNAELKSIRANTFLHVPSIRKLDLSYNQISTIEANAFYEIGHTLEYLNLAHSFSSYVSFPVELFKHLADLKFLDISYNDIENLPDSVFDSLTELRAIHLQDCKIKILSQHIFQAEKHQKLKNILFSYNFIKIISSHTFTDLKELRRINLEDNQITKIENRAFTNLEKLRHLYLRGNQINIIENEAFQNLPELELVDLAFNDLMTFDFFCLDQVGTMTSFSLNMSYNNLNQLQSKPDYEHRDLIFNANIKVIDLSFNNIWNISAEYFRPVQSSLTHLYLKGNSLSNVTSETFGNLNQLHWLDLSHNMIRHVRTYIFERTSRLQILDMSNNALDYLSIGMFESIAYLRNIDFSHNMLTTVPDYIFRDDSLESASFSYNHLSRIPFQSFSVDAAGALSAFNISHNLISAIYSPDSFAKFPRLLILDLSGNFLTRLDSYAFISLTKLVHLDISNNMRLQFENENRIFNGLERSLQTLCLKNISLQSIPSIPLPSLLHLYLSDNKISHILPELALNLTSLILLDVSGNNLTTEPIIILSLPKLQILSLSRNNITILSNSSLLSGARQITTLELAHLPLEFFETGTLSKMVSLRKLHISIYGGLYDFNVPNLIRYNYALRHLHVNTEWMNKLNYEIMSGIYPTKLNHIIITGDQLTEISSGIFYGVSSPSFNFVLRNTKIKSLSRSVFQNMNRVSNFTLDVRNNHLTNMENPAYTNIHHPLLLQKLFISGNQWTCNCDIGWVEIWERKRRQFLCSEYYTDEQAICYKTDDDIRRAFCRNKKHSLLLDVLKTDLECAWSHAPKLHHFSFTLSFIIFLIYILFIR